MSSSSRAYSADSVKAAAHPTRQVILKTLRLGESTTTELESVTGENRYNLYHHLSVLEQTGLVGSRIRERVKRFFLRKPRRPEATFLQLERDHPEERVRFEKLQRAIAEILGDEVPHVDKVSRLRVMLTYPWSDDERGK
ncbi:MAG: helix-turn-helix transcriptional regulator [Candidatus Latescibacterota bacterium]|nr:MAG: helix-turn-helix transcriptional regulator [Candidatus Latescibacterota bacterium]